MELRLSRRRFVSDFYDALDLWKPGQVRNAGETWRRYAWSPPIGAQLLHKAAWGEPSVSGLTWDPARPVIWDLDACNFQAGRPAAIFVTGFFARAYRADAWWYFEAPGAELFALAGWSGERSFGVLVGLQGEVPLPLVVPIEQAKAWVMLTKPADALAALPRFGLRHWRAWPVEDPDIGEDGPHRLEPLL